MNLRIVLLALGALFAGNAVTASAFSIYFNGEDPTNNCHVDDVSNAQLSTSGNGNLVASANTPLVLSSACGVSGMGTQQLTFGPAQPLQGPAAPLPAGISVPGNFSVLPWNAASCIVAITTTGGPGVAIGPVNGYVCGLGSTPSCASSAPISFSVGFSNTGANGSTYNSKVTCQAAAGASPANVFSQVAVNQNGNSGGTPTAAFTCSQTSSKTIGCTDQSTDSNNGTIGSWSWDFGDNSTSSQQNPQHTYNSTGTYTVQLIVTDSVNPNNTATKSTQVTVTSGGATACTTGQAGDMAGYTALCAGPYQLKKGGGISPVSPGAYSFPFIFGSNWPGSNYGYTEIFTMSKTQFLSIPFVASPGHTIIVSTNTTFTPNNNSVYSVSTQPGLFNNGVKNGTTVLCASGTNPSLTITSNNYSSARCKLNTSSTYWLNMLPGLILNETFTPCGETPCNIAVTLSGQIN